MGKSSDDRLAFNWWRHPLWPLLDSGSRIGVRDRPRRNDGIVPLLLDFGSWTRVRDKLRRNDEIEKKLGLHASPTAALNFGGRDGCIGFLCGEADQGLADMFQMMNSAKLSSPNYLFFLNCKPCF